MDDREYALQFCIESNRVTEHCPHPLFNYNTFLGEDSNLANFVKEKKT